jgi:hypothetical protein
MNNLTAERMRNKNHRNALIPERKTPFFRILRFFVIFCIFTVVSNPELWLSKSITPAGPLSQDMLSLGGFFIFREAA